MEMGLIGGVIAANHVCPKICHNDDTKHLIGTKEEAPEFYRYWED